MNRADILDAAKQAVTVDRAATHGEAETFRELLRYNSIDGELYWKATNSPRATAGSLAGCLCKRTGYRLVRVNGKLLRAHRIVWAIVKGDVPDEIDHINGDRADNRIENLRRASRSENNQNRGTASNNTSGFIGVSFEKTRGKWSAKIQAFGRAFHLGRFNSAEDAAAAYEAAKSNIHKFHGDVVTRAGRANRVQG